MGEIVDARFELLGLARPGGMGTVYRARDRQRDVVVALKVLEKSAPGSTGSMEASVLDTLEHPNIVRYLDRGVLEDGSRFVAMEWVTGIDLADWLARGPLSIDQTLALARGVAAGLAAIHAKGLVHRDVKPANLMLVDDKPELVKLVDFGIAKHVDRTEPDVVAGTPEYMAPEALRGEPAGMRADVYGLGAVLFRCLAGRPVFTGAQPLAVVAKVLLEEPPLVGDLRADVPAALEALIARTLAKDPAARPADGAELVRELATLDVRVAAVRPRPAITVGEQRVTCIVMCGGRTRGEATVPIARAGEDVAYVERVARAAGGELEALPNGSLLVHVTRGTPAQRAATAASIALAIGARRPSAPIVVATGQVIQQGDSSQVGEVIDRAASALVRGAGTWVDDTTGALLDDRFIVEPLAKGASSAWRALAGQRDAFAPVRMLLGKPAACVGRSAELAAVRAALADSAENARVRVALIIAGPGFGKSRLVSEVVAGIDPRVTCVLGARCEEVGAGSPFGVVARLVVRAAEVAESDAPEMRRAKLQRLLGRALPPAEARRIAELFAELVGARVAAEASGPELSAARADASVMLDAMRAAWCTWIGALAARGPVAIVLEDVHWGDLPSMKLLDAVLTANAANPLAVIATARPEVHDTFAALWAQHEPWELRLGALGTRAAEQLVREALVGSLVHVDVDAVMPRLVARAAGHPFHLEELVRAVAAGGDADALPDTVLGMVQARLDVLDPDARRVLRAAAVFGDTFVAEGVAALIGDALPRGAIDRHLNVLCAAEILAHVSERKELAFRHALVRDAVYATLPDGDRGIAHRAAGEWLESIGTPDAAKLAEHYDRGGAPERACKQLRRAAEQALSGEDHLCAAAFVERACRSNPNEVERGKLAAIETEIALWRGDFETAGERAEAAAARLAPGTTPWFDALGAAITAHGQRGHNAEVAALLARVAAAGIVDGPAEGACAVALCRGLLQLYWAHYDGDLAKPRARVEGIVSRGALEPYHAGWALRVRAESAWLHGHDLDACERTFAECELRFTAARALRPLALARINHASLAAWSGQTAHGDRLAADGLADAQRLGSGFLAIYARVVRAVLGAYAGDPEAQRALRSAIPTVGGSPRLAFLCRVYLGWIAEGLADFRTAAIEARTALALPVGPELRAAALALQSCLERRRGELPAALATAEAAVALEATRPDLELVAGFAALALADACEATGDRARARETIATAHGRLVALASTLADPAQRAAFLARRLPNATIVSRAREFGIA